MQASEANKGHLPAPDAVGLAHSKRVAAYIRCSIECAGGSIGFADFMHQALYASGLGYYSAGAAKFGEAGDFVTAPEVSPLFAKVLANQVADVLGQLDGPSTSIVLEFGAGSGALAAGLLQRLEQLERLPERYCILDVSADLRERQAKRINAAMPQYFDNVEWLNEPPEEFSGVVIANEVLDALPVERFVKQGSEVLRQSVACHGHDFVWIAEAADELLVNAAIDIEVGLGQKFPDGYVSEIALAVPDWISNLAAGLQEGFVFLFDYGVSQREYYAPDRVDGWLRCHFRHRAHSDPLIYPGLQDLSTWVNFSQVANAAVDADLQVAGYVTQADFLLRGGLPEELQDIAELPTETQIEWSRQVKVLTMPGEMGENFKCLGLSKGRIAAPAPFVLSDRAHTL